MLSGAALPWILSTDGALIEEEILGARAQLGDTRGRRLSVKERALVLAVCLVEDEIEGLLTLIERLFHQIVVVARNDERYGSFPASSRAVSTEMRDRGVTSLVNRPSRTRGATSCRASSDLPS